jgi:2-amino-4-hydroxy-6-hydroxymethyldihydropteridine diphosphokinase
MDPTLSIDATRDEDPSVMLLGLGANMGDRAANLCAGLVRLSSDGAIRIEAVSGLWASDPVDVSGGPFFNAAARVRTSLAPSAVLARIKAVEAALGRTGTGTDARPLDVDILYCDDLVLDSLNLHIPHPRRLDRAFVLAPLAEVCEDAQDPHARRPVAEIARERLRVLPPSARRVAGPEWFEPAATNEATKPAPGLPGSEGAAP